MSDHPTELAGPDLAAGVPLSEIPERTLFAAHAFGKPVLVVRTDGVVRAIGGQCSHYSAPLAEGVLDGDTVRCPWHHACFDLATGEATRAPALNPVAVWALDIRDNRVFAIKERPVADGATRRVHTLPVPDDVRAVIIVGAGAAGNAAAEMLRRLGYDGSLAVLSADDALPYDRPNLSKDFLAGSAPEEWIPLHPPEFYDEHEIRVILNTRVAGVDAPAQRVRMANGTQMAYDRLLLATGATPVRLSIPGAELPHVHYLRTLADSRALIAAAGRAKHAVVLGASFIGLEVAASLRARDIDVQVVAPEAVPLERVMGPEVGTFVRNLHERHGVAFRLGRTAASIDATGVTLDNGNRVDADLVVVGIGVRPDTTLAESAGLRVDRGVVVDAYLESSERGIYVAGDCARWPDLHHGGTMRVEHWVVAERQGQTAAKNMLGRQEPFDAVPFFWSAHYDTAIRYVGHAEQWDAVRIDGDLAAGDATVSLMDGPHVRAVMTVGRDRAALHAELEMEAQHVR